MTVPRIDGPQGPRRLDPTSTVRIAAPQEPDRTGATDRVEVSATARRLMALVGAASEHTGIREERVAELRSSVSQGIYEVDPRAVARAIAEFEDGLSR